MTVIDRIFVPRAAGETRGGRPNILYEDFCSAKYPRGKVAIECVEGGPPGLTNDGYGAIFDHHSHCVRSATLSASEQAYEFVKFRLHEEFGPMVLYKRDPDEDSSGASFILENPDEIGKPLLREIITLEGREGRSSGLYPVKHRSHLLGRLLWIAKPYAWARRRGLLDGADDALLHGVTDRMHYRFRETINGRGREIEPDIRLEVLGEYPQWTFFREIGVNARLGIGMRGIKAFGSLTSQRDGRWWYSLGRISPLIRSFPLERIRPYLNAIEGIPDGMRGGWGGNTDTIIGAPFAGSKIPPHELPEHVNRACQLP